MILTCANKYLPAAYSSMSNTRGLKSWEIPANRTSHIQWEQCSDNPCIGRGLGKGSADYGMGGRVGLPETPAKAQTTFSFDLHRKNPIQGSFDYCQASQSWGEVLWRSNGDWSLKEERMWFCGVSTVRWAVRPVVCAASPPAAGGGASILREKRQIQSAFCCVLSCWL